MHRKPEVPEGRRSSSGRMSRWPCKDYLKGTCTNPFCEKWHPPECLFYKTKSGCRFGKKYSYAHHQVDEQPSKRSTKNDDKSAVAMLKKDDWPERRLVTDQRHDRPRVVVGLGEKCSFAHRQVDEQPTKKVLKEWWQKCRAMLKKGDWQEREPGTDECHDRPGKPGKRSDKKLGQNSSKRQSSDARQLGCVFQDMTPPKSILPKGTHMPKPIQRVKFT